MKGFFKKTFTGDGSDFSALYEAQKWLSDNGYSYGPSSWDGPIGVVKGQAYIAKWRNMTKREQESLDGLLDAGRSGPAHLTLKQDPETIRKVKSDEHLPR